MKPAVVVTAYNRPAALTRLLESVDRAEYPAGVTLIISIDGGHVRHEAVCEVADRFEWRPGEKRVIGHSANLGLVEHVYFCNDLALEHGAVIRLEDDEQVSRQYYRYAQAALDYYEDDPRIAGIALYALWFNGFTRLPFVPYPDAGDVFFLQNPWSQGQAYTAQQWAAFREWQGGATRRVAASDPIHEMYMRFTRDDWFPEATKYLAETGRYYVFPRESHVTNMGDTGTHFSQVSRWFQVPLQHRRREYRFIPLDEAVAVYDSFMEMQPDRLKRLTDRLAGYDYELDLNGAKSPGKIRKPYALTVRPCHHPIMRFGLAMWPPEENVIAGMPGDEIALCRLADLKYGRLHDLIMGKRLYDYAIRRRPISRWRRLMWWGIHQLQKFGLLR